MLRAIGSKGTRSWGAGVKNSASLCFLEIPRESRRRVKTPAGMLPVFPPRLLEIFSNPLKFFHFRIDREIGCGDCLPAVFYKGGTMEQ